MLLAALAVAVFSIPIWIALALIALLGAYGGYCILRDWRHSPNPPPADADEEADDIERRTW